MSSSSSTSPPDTGKQLDVIRCIETAVFWIDRVIIACLIFLFTWFEKYILHRSSFVLFVFGFSNVNHLFCFIERFIERQQIRPLSFEPDAIVFYAERVGMLGVVLHSFGKIKWDFGLHILKLMQLFLLVQYLLMDRLKNDEPDAIENSKDEESKKVEPNEVMAKKEKPNSEIFAKTSSKCFLCGLRWLIRAIHACHVQLWNSLNSTVNAAGEADDAKKDGRQNESDSVHLLPDEPKRDQEDVKKDGQHNEPDSVHLFPDEPKREQEEGEGEAYTEQKTEQENDDEAETVAAAAESKTKEEKGDAAEVESEEENVDEIDSESESEEEEESEDETETESEEEDDEDEARKEDSKVDEKELKIMKHAMEVSTKILIEISELRENLAAKIEKYQFQVEADRRRWAKEKRNFTASIKIYRRSVEAERCKWGKEKENLSEKIEKYQSAEAEYAADRQKWEKEKQELHNRIQNYERVLSTWDNHAKIFQEKQEELKNYSKCTEEKRSLEVELGFTKKMVEKYKADCLRYKEEKLDLEARLAAEVSMAEGLNWQNGVLEAKCQRLEEEKSDLTGKLSAAKGACELYRSYLRYLNTGFK